MLAPPWKALCGEERPLQSSAWRSGRAAKMQGVSCVLQMKRGALPWLMAARALLQKRRQVKLCKLCRRTYAERRFGDAMSPKEKCEMWEALARLEAGPIEVTSELLQNAWKNSGFRDPEAVRGQSSLPLHHVVFLAFPELFPSISGAKRALKRGFISVNQERIFSGSAKAPEVGALLRASVERSLEKPKKSERWKSIDQRLEMWNAGKGESSQIRVLHHDTEWAVVNKPPGLHTSPVGLDVYGSLTFQSYLPALIPPPAAGSPCRGGPKPCRCSGGIRRSDESSE